MRVRPPVATSVGSPATALSVLIPVWNERECLPNTLEHLDAVIATLGMPCEVVVVDDGSADGTAELLSALSQRYPWLRTVSHPANRGKGAALRTAFAAARFPWCLYTDADLPVDLRVLHDVLPLTAEADLIAGYRTTARENWRRALLSSGYASLVRLLFHLPFTHPGFPFKLLRRALVEQVRLTADDFFFDTELLVRLTRLRCRIREVPVAYHPRQAGVSKVLARGIWRNIRSCLPQLWALWRH